MFETVRPQRTREPVAWRQYFAAVAAILATTWINFQLEPYLGYHTLSLVFLFVVVLLGAFVGRGPTLLAAAASALIWDYYFEPPAFTFRIESTEDAMMFGMYFLVAITLGQMTARIRAQQRIEHEREERATALFQLSRELAGAADENQVLELAVQQAKQTFKAQTVMLPADETNHLAVNPHPAGTGEMGGQEREAAAWVFEHGQPGGKFTHHLPQCSELYVPLKGNGGIVGVMGLRFKQARTPTIHERTLLDSFAQQVGLAVERHRLRQLSEKSRLLMESERLSKTLLNSISHEIRTPLTVIVGAAGNLVEHTGERLSKSQRATVAEIREAAERLNRLVGKVFEITRLESGGVKPKLEAHEVEDLINSAMHEVRRELAQHPVTVEMAPGLPLIRMDVVLMRHALANLLSNAAFHTPPGTSVEARARAEDNRLILEVADRGGGVPVESLPRLFDKFYRAPAARTGGTGLGLSIVKGFVEAQGGQVAAKNREGGGAVFVISLPLNNPAAASSG